MVINLLNKKEEAATEKAYRHLSKKIFKCTEDAIAATKAVQKKYYLWKAEINIEVVEGHTTKGRPKKGSVKESKGYKITYTITQSDEEIAKALRRKGRFVLATNNLNQEQLPGASILRDYKEQQKVEGGFRFLKDPWFMVDSFFLKKASRIEALMMIMVMTLMVYNFAQHKLRQTLLKNNDTLPNQLNKEVKNPTMRWIFQQMQGVCIIQIYDPIKGVFRNIITRLTPIREKIIRLMGRLACQMYGLHECLA